MRINELVHVLAGGLLLLATSLECGKSDQWVIEIIKRMFKNTQNKHETILSSMWQKSSKWLISVSLRAFDNFLE